MSLTSTELLAAAYVVANPEAAASETLPVLHQRARRVADAIKAVQGTPKWATLTAPQQEVLVRMAGIANGTDPLFGTFRVQYLHRCAGVGAELARAVMGLGDAPAVPTAQPAA